MKTQFIKSLGDDWKLNTNYEAMVRNIQNELESYIVNAKLKSLVIGISGGIDSAICAALAKPVCDKLGIPLIGVSIPIQSNHKDEINRALGIGKHFCTKFHEADLGFTYQELSHKYEGPYIPSIAETDFERKIRMGNIKARMRMIYLYNQAQMNKGMVISTDNYTEYLLGFWTLHGDVGDYGMIQQLWKTEVYGLADYVVNKLAVTYEFPKAFSLQACIDAVPTDGLGITNSDLDQLGAFSYDEVDGILQRLCLASSQSTVIPYDPVTKRHIASEFKRNNPFNIFRELILKA